MTSVSSSQFTTISHRDAIPPPPTAICCPLAPIAQNSSNLYINHFLAALQALKQQGDGALTTTPLFPLYSRAQTQANLWPPPAHRVIKLQICTNASRYGRDYRHAKCFILKCDMEDTETKSSHTKPVMEVDYAHMYPTEAWKEVDEMVVEYSLQYEAVKEGGGLWMEKQAKPSDGEEVRWICKGCDVQVWIKELGVSPF